MATVSDLLARKDGRIHTVSPGATVLEATRRMNEHRIGALVVTDGHRIEGIFTERDVLQRIVAEQRSPLEVRVRDVMTRDVLCCAPDTEVDQVSRIMKEQRVRHLPVRSPDGRLVGLISIGDVNAFHVSDQEATIHLLNEYLCSR